MIFRAALSCVALLLLLSVAPANSDAALGLLVGVSAGRAEVQPAKDLSYVLHVTTPAGSTLTVPVSVHVPRHTPATRGLTPLVALHGMRGDGATFSQPLTASADRHGWVLVAPTFFYGDWHDPDQVHRDATEIIPAIRAVLSDLPARTNLRISRRVLFYGFSRGAQVAHRFALFHPEQALGVAALSAGTYTLPTRTRPDGTDQSDLNFPFGVADVHRYTGVPFQEEGVRHVQFWVGVGGKDDRVTDVPRSWDSIEGTCRTERAAAFAAALRGIGAPVRHVQFPDTGHSETPQMRADAVQFLATTIASAEY